MFFNYTFIDDTQIYILFIVFSSILVLTTYTAVALINKLNVCYILPSKL